MSALDLPALLGALELEELGADRYCAPNIPSDHGVVFGGQLLAQTVVAGMRGLEPMAVKTLHTMFVRSARPTESVEIDVERMHQGRTFAGSTVTIRQGDRLC